MKLTKEDSKELALRGYADPVFFCGFFLHDWFPGVLADEPRETSMPWMHRGMLAILRRRCDFLDLYGEVDEKIIPNFFYEVDGQRRYIFSRGDDGQLQMELTQYTLLLMPRGFAKTSILNASTLMDIAYQDSPFAFYISKTGRHAIRQLSSISTQLSTNGRIRAVFGELRPEQRNDEGLRWSESEGFVQTASGIALAAAGRGAQVRGMLVNGKRPHRLNIDDLEDQESTKTDDRRKDTRDWFFSDLLPVLDELDPTSSAVMLSNLVHADCLATWVARDPLWTTVKFGALDLDGEPVWGAKMDHQKLERKKKSYSLQGKLARFYMEYLNEVRTDEEKKFPVLPAVVPRPLTAEVPKAIVLDPAISQSRESDPVCCAVVEMHPKGLIHIRDCRFLWGREKTHRAIIDLFFDMAKENLLKPSDAFGVESVAFQQILEDLFREEMFRRHFYFDLQGIKHLEPEARGKSKIERVEGVLVYRMNMGFISAQKHFPDLEVQLDDWPSGKKDGPDTVAMAVNLLSPAAPMAATEDLGADTMPPLSEVFGGDWRSH